MAHSALRCCRERRDGAGAEGSWASLRQLANRRRHRCAARARRRLPCGASCAPRRA